MPIRSRLWMPYSPTLPQLPDTIPFYSTLADLMATCLLANIVYLLLKGLTFCCISSPSLKEPQNTAGLILLRVIRNASACGVAVCCCCCIWIPWNTFGIP